MDGKNGLNVVDVIGINYIVLKVCEVEPVSRWPWWIVLSPWLIYIGLIAVSALVVNHATKNRKKN